MSRYRRNETGEHTLCAEFLEFLKRRRTNYSRTCHTLGSVGNGGMDSSGTKKTITPTGEGSSGAQGSIRLPSPWIRGVLSVRLSPGGTFSRLRCLSAGLFVRPTAALYRLTCPRVSNICFKLL